MLKPIAFANAVTVITAISYIICVLISYLAPDFVFGIAQSWIHSLNLESIKSTAQISFGSFVYGSVTISVITWVTAYASIVLYNKWAK